MPTSEARTYALGGGREPQDGGAHGGQVAVARRFPTPKTHLFSNGHGPQVTATPRAKRRAASCPYKIIEKDNGDAWVVMGGKEYSPPRYRRDPGQFKATPRTTWARRSPGRHHGCRPTLRISAQATKMRPHRWALGCAHHHERRPLPGLWLGKKKDEQIAVYDWGGGTFDISILDSATGVRGGSTNGDTSGWRLFDR
jgi:molecular chaperone DnaK